MKYPTTRFVFDRKNTATKTKDALIQVEVLLSGKKKYISTGVKVYKDQWNSKSFICNRDDMFKLNDRINSTKAIVDEYIVGLAKKKEPFDWDAFNRFLQFNNDGKITFLDYISQRIEQRGDLSLSTKKSHRKIVSSLMNHGKIVSFDELTKANIADYYDFLLGRKITKIGKDGKEYKVNMAPQTVWGYMKILRTYIHDAMAHDLLDRDPSIGIKVRRGNTETQRWLTEDEVKMIEEAEMPNGSLARVRDLFILSCYSGMAFSDLMDFNPEKLEKEGDYTYLVGKRVKTGQEYIVLVLPKVKEILEKYDYKLPRYSNQQFNHRLKKVAEEAGINKEISSHWGRHTAAMMFLNRGIRMETVAKALGHSSIKITEQVYASILKRTIGKEMTEAYTAKYPSKPGQ